MDDDDAPGLPIGIEAAWRRGTRPRRGPRPGLSVDRIVQAAVRLAAAEGLGAVSMARVAGELGAAPMSLYRHVGSKGELVALMVDAALGRPAPASPEAEGWRTGLRRWARAYQSRLLVHPWVLRVPISGPQTTPNIMAWLEDGLRSLRETALGEAEKLSVMLLVSGYVRNAATLAADMAAAAAAQGGGQVMPAWGRLLSRLTDPADFPCLHAALAAGVFDQDDDPDDEFRFGLERVLDGIEVLVRTRS